ADFAFTRRMVGVVPHERGKIESHGESATAVSEEILVALVGLFRRSEAGELAHSPELAAVAAGMDPARVRRLSGIVEIRLGVPVFRKIGLGVETADGLAADGGEPRVAVLVKIHATGRADRLFRGLLQCPGQSGLRPALLWVGGMAAFKHVADWALSDTRIFLFLGLICHRTVQS